MTQAVSEVRSSVIDQALSSVGSLLDRSESVTTWLSRLVQESRCLVDSTSSQVDETLNAAYGNSLNDGFIENSARQIGSLIRQNKELAKQKEDLLRERNRLLREQNSTHNPEDLRRINVLADQISQNEKKAEIFEARLESACAHKESLQAGIASRPNKKDAEEYLYSEISQNMKGKSWDECTDEERDHVLVTRSLLAELLMGQPIEEDGCPPSQDTNSSKAHVSPASAKPASQTVAPVDPVADFFRNETEKLQEKPTLAAVKKMSGFSVEEIPAQKRKNSRHVYNITYTNGSGPVKPIQLSFEGGKTKKKNLHWTLVRAKDVSALAEFYEVFTASNK